MTKKRAYIVAFEGIDGSGKRTQFELLARNLRDHGKSVSSLSFPQYANTFFGSLVGMYLNGAFGEATTVHPQLASLLYAGDRFESKSLLSDLVYNSDVVLLDRYVNSNLAYQGAKLPKSEMEAFINRTEWIEYDLYKLPQAHVTIWFDIPVGVAYKNVAKKKPRNYTEQTHDQHESNIEYMSSCSEAYQHLYETRKGWIKVECVDPNGEMRSPEDIAEEVWLRLPDHIV